MISCVVVISRLVNDFSAENNFEPLVCINLNEPILLCEMQAGMVNTVSCSTDWKSLFLLTLLYIAGLEDNILM